MRGDRASAYASLSLSLEDALAVELKHGMASLATGEAASGATAFARGTGRHGSFE